MSFSLNADTLAPVVTVQLGQPVTLTCVFTESLQSTSWIHWYKQTAGDTLKVIAMLRKNTSPYYGPGFNSSNFKTMDGDKMSNLTILRTALQDEGMYHCAHIGWLESTWNGIYLSLKGKYLIKLQLYLLWLKSIKRNIHIHFICNNTPYLLLF